MVESPRVSRLESSRTQRSLDLRSDRVRTVRYVRLATRRAFSRRRLSLSFSLFLPLFLAIRDLEQDRCAFLKLRARMHSVLV